MERKLSSPYQPFESIIQKGHDAGLPEPKRFDGIYLRNWFDENENVLQDILHSKLQSSEAVEDFYTMGEEYLSLTPSDIALLIGLFPQKSQDRSSLSIIRGMPTRWMYKNITIRNKRTTEQYTERLSDTGLALGQTEYLYIDKQKHAVMDLYQVSHNPDVYTESTARLIQAATFVHEYFHSLAQLYAFPDTIRYLMLPSGELTRTQTFIERVFRPLAEEFPPVSKYGKAFRKDDEKYSGKRLHARQKGISEEFAEYGTLFLLGYNLGTYVDITRDPFADRPGLAEFFRDFLSAKGYEAKIEDPLVADVEAALSSPSSLLKKYRSM